MPLVKKALLVSEERTVLMDVRAREAPQDQPELQERRGSLERMALRAQMDPRDLLVLLVREV